MSPLASRLRIYFPEDALTVNLEATPLGGQYFRLEEGSIFIDSADFGDIINLEKQANGVYRFQGVATRSAFKSTTAVLSKATTESKEFGRFLEQVIASGGYWEIRFGGLVIVAVPEGAPIDPTTELARFERPS